MIAAFKRALRIDQNIRDVLDVAHLGVASPYLEQRIVRRRAWICGVEKQHAAKTSSRAGGELPILSLDVVNDRRSGPGQESRNDKPDALAGAGRRKAKHVLGTVVTKIVTCQAAKHDAVRIKK